ncbi:MAG: hypothetical protein ACM30G_11435 [Micromonosporaceae bacterium]
MHKTSIAGAVAAAALAVIAPAASATAAPVVDFPPAQAGWFSVPTAPRDLPAGVFCDAPARFEATVDQVVERVLTTYADGSPHFVQFTGPLVLRVTNTLTGASTDVDASGSADVELHQDGGQSWKVLGGVLIGFRDGHGNRPRGIYRLDGTYEVEIAASGDRFLTMRQGTEESICDLIE